jgi:hypothetical protein
MDRQEIISRERRWAPIVLGLTLIAVLFVFLGPSLGGASSSEVNTDSERLIERNDSAAGALAGDLLAAVGLALLVAPLLLLFDAAKARVGGRLGRFRLLVILAPILVGISAAISGFGLNSVAADFASSMPVSGPEAGSGSPAVSEGLVFPIREDIAESLVQDSGALQAAAFVSLGGFFGLVFSVVYAALWGMRTGLLTRFWATLGMAFAAFVILGSAIGLPFGLPGTFFFLVHVALVANGRWFGEQPPAWAAGKAIPGPAPGEEPATDTEAGEEPARPEDFEGTGTEISSGRPGRRDNRRKRKRKQRGN